MNKLSFLFFLCSHVLILGAQVCYAQQRPFAGEIRLFKQQDSVAKPPKNGIVFTGSSSIRKWENLEGYFPKHKVINRGFGGSTLVDLLGYIDEVVLPYTPRQVVIYSGENDLASHDSVSAQLVFVRFQQVFNKIRKSLPQSTITFISIKPSPSRPTVWDRAKEANTLVSAFLKQHKRTSFVDVYAPMLEGQRPKPNLFLSDSLHMNKEGYVLWQHILEPYLLK